MLLFQPIKTRRICVRLKELTIGQAIALCKLPADRHELMTTEFLRQAAAEAEAPAGGYVTDPRLWTVQERARMVCHYLAQVADDGPDFAVGEGKLTDYLDFTADIGTDGRVRDPGMPGWAFGPLLGGHAELLERSCSSRGEWLLGAMACQALPTDQADELLALPDIDQLAELDRRTEAIKALPESEFEALLVAYDHVNCTALHHFLQVAFDADGVVFEAREAGLAPARFLADPCIGVAARSIFGSAR